MTDTTESLDGARLLSPSTRRTYTADWALFTDWCAATGTVALPADPGTVLAFLADAPAPPPRCADGSPPSTTTMPALDTRGRASRWWCGPHSTDPPADPSNPPSGAPCTRRYAACPRTAGRRACSAGGTGRCWSCPNWRGCRTRTSPG